MSIPAGDEGFVYVLSGKGYFSSGVRQSADQVGHLAHTSATDRPTTLNVSANEPIGFLLWQEDQYGNQ